MIISLTILSFSQYALDLSFANLYTDKISFERNMYQVFKYNIYNISIARSGILIIDIYYQL